jgi:hypothetical protein
MEELLQRVIKRGENHEIFKPFLNLSKEQSSRLTENFMRYLENLNNTGKVDENTYTTSHIIDFLRDYKFN